MLVELNKKELIYLVHGVAPRYTVYHNVVVRAVGAYQGGRVEKWIWFDNLNDLTENELFEVYTICVNSWK